MCLPVAGMSVNFVVEDMLYEPKLLHGAVGGTDGLLGESELGRY